MVCAQCGADIAASQDVCHRCGHSASADGALTSYPSAIETPAPLPAGAEDDDLTIAPVSQRSQPEPDTHARPAVVSGGEPTVGVQGTTPINQGTATGVFQ